MRIRSANVAAAKGFVCAKAKRQQHGFNCAKAKRQQHGFNCAKAKRQQQHNSTMLVTQAFSQDVKFLA
ncbi:hypothetical protein LAV72_24050 [Lysinibacillus xylanilyticus]|uniref:hypothetical protein n=1 Tax=Lysinibacillus xylanilyticus TaxID=582475 RepID=UPI002B24ED9E|nr:hypothetical protein [Lysinibacillus xylanilyticus]MEB2302674.1 hypothetical protein [Lysinibacillus xylanilyticus]